LLRASVDAVTLTAVTSAGWAGTTLQIVVLAFALAAAHAMVTLGLVARGPSTSRRREASAPDALTPALTVDRLAEVAAAPVETAPPPAPEPAPQPSPIVRPAPLVPLSQRDATTWCEIRWWRGYFASTFYAVVVVGATEAEHVIAESPAFRWRRAEPPPDQPTAAAALKALLANLEEHGWRVVGRGDEWFSVHLQRGAPGV
jgi:hypothetical protein